MVKRTTMSTQSAAEAQMAHSRMYDGSTHNEVDLKQPLMANANTDMSFSFRGGGGSTLKFT